MFGVLYAADGSDPDALLAVAQEFTPRCEINGPRDITLDLTGLTRLLGDAHTIGAELQRTATARGLFMQVAIAGTRTAARLLAVGRGFTPRPSTRSGRPELVEGRQAGREGPPYDDAVCVVEPGTEAAAIARLPLSLLTHVAGDNELLPTFRQWGLRTLGDIATLPADAVAARLGKRALVLQRLARGEDLQPLVPALPEERFEQALDLEWPIEGLEPLSFVLGRLMEPLSAHLERRGRGAEVLHVRLHLVTRTVHERSQQLPAPIRDARALRTLALLDLESHPPSAAIDRVVVAVDPTPGRVLQFSLLTRPLPLPEQLSTLMARLTALMGEGRCGSPVAVDTWQPGAFAMKPFAPTDHEPRRHRGTGTNCSSLDDLRVSVPPWPVIALRRFRIPIPVRVRIDQDTPVRLMIDRRGFSGGHVDIYAGPWRTSGNWWNNGSRRHGVTEDTKNLRVSVSPWLGEVWDRDEWDLTLSDGATYRVYRDRTTDAWFLEGIVD
jgi:protein ImuB